MHGDLNRGRPAFRIVGVAGNIDEKLLNGNIYNDDDTVKERAFTNPKAKLAVLSALEYEVLNAYQCIPFAAETAATLFSKKIGFFSGSPTSSMLPSTTTLCTATAESVL